VTPSPTQRKQVFIRSLTAASPTTCLPAGAVELGFLSPSQIGDSMAHPRRAPSPDAVGVCGKTIRIAPVLAFRRR
jgi:hypothetical protein